ncbi:hypothetical protein Ddc_21109 [Ditylenchus destructor]|nr:hypothetical protein Ddc_21109 [Ditylenchus destructor]
MASVPYTLDTDKIKANDTTILDEICGKLDNSAKWDTHYLDAQRPDGHNAFTIRNSGIMTNVGDNWTILVVKRAKPLSQIK